MRFSGSRLISDLVVVVDNLQAVMGGLNAGQGQLGKMMLSGLAPNGASPGGAPPPVDPFQRQFAEAIQALNALAQGLQRSGDMQASTTIQECGIKVQKEMMQRQDRMQKMAADQMQMGMGGGQGQQPFPNVNGGGVV